ncbi:MAG: chemotaxis protein CheC [Defluviitaleaceae bacterium]|nr:chemotaxis protein CheC [Defluviitaleaceae bacterium]
MTQSFSNIDQLNEMHFDVLKEIGNIGVGNAVGALSELISSEVKMSVPHVQFLKFNEVGSILGSEETIVFGVLVQISGDINGMMMFLLKPDSARVLVNGFMGIMPLDLGASEFSDIELSAIEEIGNILCSSYLGAMSRFVNKSVKPSPPILSIDMAAAILSVPAIEFSKMSDGVLLIDTFFETKEMNASGFFFLVPDFESFGVILSSLGVG